MNHESSNRYALDALLHEGWYAIALFNETSVEEQQMNTEAMAEQASKRVSMYVNRAAAQHSNAIERSFHESECWSVESMESAAAEHQKELDKVALLYELGCKYGISMTDSRRLCDVAGVSFQKLMDSTGSPATY